MAKVEFRDEGWNDLIAELVAETRQAAFNAVYQGSQTMRTAVLRKLSGRRSGRTYRVPGTERTYTASAPGEAPAVMLDNLRPAVTATIPVMDAKEVWSRVGVDGQVVPYARRLELGGMANGVYLEKRPYLRPTFAENEERVLKIMQRWANK
jgi:hypothetical protein